MVSKGYGLLVYLDFVTIFCYFDVSPCFDGYHKFVLVETLGAEHIFIQLPVINYVGMFLPAGIAAVSVFGIDTGAYNVTADVKDGCVGFYRKGGPLETYKFARLGNTIQHQGIGVDEGTREMAFDDLFVVARITSVVEVADLLHRYDRGFGQAVAACKQGST